MAWAEADQGILTGAPPGWEAALLEFEHQAEHWDTPDHREIGQLIASALRAAVDIARSGGLRCEHRPGSLSEDGLDAAGSAARDKAIVTHTAGVRRYPKCRLKGDWSTAHNWPEVTVAVKSAELCPSMRPGVTVFLFC